MPFVSEEPYKSIVLAVSLACLLLGHIYFCTREIKKHTAFFAFLLLPFFSATGFFGLFLLFVRNKNDVED